MNKTGKCQLCLDEPVELRSSHFFPKAAYKIMREEAIRTGWRMNPNPVLMTDRSAVQTSEQYTARLLCHRCEQRFSANGENWVLRHCWRGKTFYLLSFGCRCNTAPRFGRCKRLSCSRNSWRQHICAHILRRKCVLACSDPQLERKKH